MTERISLPEGVPPLTQFYVYMTAGCNLACQHCWLSPVYQPKGTTGGHLEYELFKIALEEGIPLGLQGVKLTGGEPLLHPDFLRFVDLINEKKIGLTIETNATLMTPDIARYLKEKSTLWHISVSIDGAHSDSHDAFRGIPGAFEKAVAGIKDLVNVGYQPQIIMSLHKGNIDEIEEVVHLAQIWGAGSIKFNLIQPSGRGELMTGRRQVLEIKKLIEIGNWIENDLQKKTAIRLIYSWPIIFQSVDRLLRQSSDSCGIFGILGLLANGSIALCGIGMEIPELTYGQLGEDNIKEIWYKNEVLLALRRGLPSELTGVCEKCIFKWQCLGFCVAENYHLSKKLTGPFWLCQQAYEAGLLPMKRIID